MREFSEKSAMFDLRILEYFSNIVDGAGWHARCFQRLEQYALVLFDQCLVQKQIQFGQIDNTCCIRFELVGFGHFRMSEDMAEPGKLAIASDSQDNLSVFAGIDALWLNVGMIVAPTNRNLISKKVVHC